MKGEVRVTPVGEGEALELADQYALNPTFASLSVFRVLLRTPQLAKSVAGLLETLLRGEHLDGRLRELVIMRIGWVTGSCYEWTQHWRVARLMGIPEETLLGVRDWQSQTGYGAAERAVLAATDETIEAGTISPETWQACRDCLGSDEALIELVAAIGNWRLFSSLLRSLEVPLEEGVEAWPPDGREPVRYRRG